MTTTAEKIKVMQAFDAWKKKGFDQPALIEKSRRDTDLCYWEDVGYEPWWNWEEFEYRIKPPKPEPLERWATAIDDRITGYYRNNAPVDLDKERVVHLREVTPQMKQDERDAKRYRWWKYHHIPPGDNTADPSAWDDRADKAMED